MPLNGNSGYHVIYMISSLRIFPWVERNHGDCHAQSQFTQMRRLRPRGRKWQQTQDQKSWLFQSHQGLKEGSRSLHIHFSTLEWATESETGFSFPTRLLSPKMTFANSIRENIFSLCFWCLMFKLSLKVVFWKGWVLGESETETDCRAI